MIITKSPSSTTYNDDGSVSYTYTVTNVGNLDLNITSVIDNLIGSIPGFVGKVVGADGGYISTVPYKTNQSQFDVDSITNNVTATS